MNQLETVLAKEVEVIREMFNDANTSHFEIKIEVTGRSSSLDPVKIEYTVSEHGYSGVEGDNILICAVEYLRRKGWTKAHGPKELLPPPRPQEIEDETF